MAEAPTCCSGMIGKLSAENADKQPAAKPAEIPPVSYGE